MNEPPLKSLHPDSSLSAPKLNEFRKWSTARLVESLKPGQSNSLRVRPNGTLMEGHHRISILRERGFEVDTLPREILEKT